MHTGVHLLPDFCLTSAWLAALHFSNRSQNYTTLLSGLFSKSNFFGKMSEEIFVAYETSGKDYVETMQNRNTRE